MLGHGSRLLGLVRAGAYSLYGKPKYPVSGTDQVYGLNVARFLADNDRPDQLVLSLYGMLGASMTPEHVRLGRGGDGRAAARSLVPVDVHAAEHGQQLGLPRDVAADARPRDGATSDGTPVGLDLAFATPRPWLGERQAIAVNAAPTSFGALTYELRRDGNRLAGTVTSRRGARRPRSACACGFPAASSCGPCA